MIKYHTEKDWRYCRSEHYNWNFNMKTGFFARWGKTLRDDPEIAPSPEILDCEISTKCNGKCAFCYKSNTSNGDNMSFDMFKVIFDKIPQNLTQIAFGIGSL